jgi:hypothetical protein
MITMPSWRRIGENARHAAGERGGVCRVGTRALTGVTPLSAAHAERDNLRMLTAVNDALAQRSESAFGAISQGRRHPATLTHGDNHRRPGMLLSVLQPRGLRVVGF